MEQTSGHNGVQRQQSQERLAEFGRIAKFFGTGVHFPAVSAQALTRRHTKPMERIFFLVAQPLQRLALLTTHLIPGVKGFDDPHVTL